MSAQASSLDSAKAIQNKTNTASAASQTRIDKSAESSVALHAEIEQLQEEIKNLEVYRNHLEGMVSSQENEVKNLESQIVEIKQTRQGIVPLMYQMIDGLKNVVADDKPIRLAQRHKRIARLESIMTRADVSEAEKYRRILEAYQIELDYGTKMSTYQDKITMADGDSIEADILYIGRLSLLARNHNGTRYWSWDQQSGQWDEMSASMKADLDKAYNLANQQIAPSLLTLPVSLNVAEAN